MKLFGMFGLGLSQVLLDIGLSMFRQNGVMPIHKYKGLQTRRKSAFQGDIVKDGRYLFPTTKKTINYKRQPKDSVNDQDAQTRKEDRSQNGKKGRRNGSR